MPVTEPVTITRKMLCTDRCKPTYSNLCQEGWEDCDWLRPEVSKHGGPSPAHQLLLHSFTGTQTHSTCYPWLLFHDHSRARWLLTETMGLINPQSLPTSGLGQQGPTLELSPVPQIMMPLHNERKLDTVELV